jgi:predicted nucleic acid-binding protein
MACGREKTQNNYFDANALVKFYKKQKGTLNIRRLVSRTPIPILVSSTTVLEYFGVVMKYRRLGEFKKGDVNSLYKHLEKEIGTNGDTNRPFKVIPIPDGAFQLAKNILLHHALMFRVESNDALHLAIVKKLQTQPPVVMVTSDQPMQKVCERISIPFYDPAED